MILFIESLRTFRFKKSAVSFPLGLGKVDTPPIRAHSEPPQGPELVTSGPWKPITLNTFTSRISELESSALVDVQSLETCLTLVTKIESVRPMDFMVEIVLRDDKGSIVWSDHASLDGEQSELVTEWKFAAGDIQLWWPSGYGEATLYELSVTLLTMVRRLSPGYCMPTYLR